MEDVPAEAVPAEAAATRDACVNGAAPGIGAAPAAAADTNGTPAAAAAPPAEAAAEEAGKATAAAVAAEPPAAQPPALQQAPDEALSFVPACVVHFQFEADEAAEDVGYPEVKEGLGGREQGVFYVEYQKARAAWCTLCTAWCLFVNMQTFPFLHTHCLIGSVGGMSLRTQCPCPCSCNASRYGCRGPCWSSALSCAPWTADVCASNTA